ncbi:MAG: Unknown protein [uncultured Thiotrichaceae bacterium]|uniref:Thioredoxin domain-containing protein n=1 Tax=uncultured Thiotrichaceae bacterium TaxID=298394 RepID=A0A6S6TYG0_9GAMM|nr:MAG: Unknown protein [uncultured Thiotrichaceae bacterium]
MSFRKSYSVLSNLIYSMTSHLKLFAFLPFLTLLIIANTSQASMTDMQGQPAALSKYVGKGQWVVVEAWHSECGTCKDTMPELVESANSMPNTTLVGVSLDNDLKKAKGFIDSFEVNFPTLLTNINDFDSYVRKIAKKPLSGAPTYLIFSPAGKLKAMQSGNIRPTEIKAYIQRQSL